MKISYKLGDMGDLAAMVAVGQDLFDQPVKPTLAQTFLTDSRHHIALAYDGDQLIGMVSGLHYIHPDKEPQMFINEAGVVATHQNKGIGRSLVRFLCAHAKTLGCSEAWVLTVRENIAARKMYEAADGKGCSEGLVLYEFE